MQRLLFITLIAVALPAAAEDMRPNKEPVPSPSDLRSATGEDRPQGQAREARTPSPSDLATERPRLAGDRRPAPPQDPRPPPGGSPAYQSIREDNRGQPLPAR